MRSASTRLTVARRLSLVVAGLYAMSPLAAMAQTNPYQSYPSYPQTTTPSYGQTMPAQVAPAAPIYPPSSTYSTVAAPPTMTTSTGAPTSSTSTSSTGSTTSSTSAPGAPVSGISQTAQAGAVSQAAPLIGANPSGPPPTSLLQYQQAGVRPAPFGSELFSGGNLTATTVGVVDPTYIMKPGDQIALVLWGSVPDTNATAVVDTNGNIFIPGVGPVNVGGRPAGTINGVVKAAAAAVYRSAVHIYAAPVTTVPISVFVTGPVIAPGPYAGLGSDSPVAFLQRAGGIDANRGSYRNIQIKRNGVTIAHIDLYEFLRTGELPPVPLHNNDTIVVGQQGSVVSVSGIARAPFTFELGGRTGAGEELLYYGRPRPEVNYVALLGYRNAQPLNEYLPVQTFARQMMMDGDRISFSADAISDTVLVSVTGAFHGPASYVVAKETSVGAVLASISMDSMADRRYVYLQRVSAAFTQKQLLSEALARLQKAVYTQPEPTAALATAQAQQATVIQNYINFASQIQPIGIVAFPPGADLTRVSLEPNDVIVVPFKSQVVTVGGEVVTPQSTIWQPGMRLVDYVRKAGGFGKIADRKHILIIHPDSSAEVNVTPGPGDRVLVTVHLPTYFLDVATAFTQVIYQIAIGAAAAVHL